MGHISIDPSAPLPPFRRTVDAAMVEHKGTPMLMLRDTEGIAEQVMLVSPAALLLITLLDGKNSLSDIRALIMKSTGSLVPEQALAELVDEFDKASFLETPQTAARRAKAEAQFMASPVRKPALAGLSYPEDPLELAKFMGDLLKAPGGPGVELAAKPIKPAPLAGLVAPHIDLSRGAASYAWAYGELAQHPRPDVIVAVGVAHSGPNAPWVFSNKTYQTPAGDMALDQKLHKELSACLWYPPQEDESAHKTEHSLEFQALLLKYLWRDDAPPWVPILASSFERFSPDAPPSGIETVNSALERMGAVLAKQAAEGRRIMILAAVDISHVGPHFGDQKEVTPDMLKDLEIRDRASLQLALQLDADGFYRDVVAGGNPRHVCGLSALYTATRLLRACAPGAKGTLLNYATSPDPTGGAVSFAAASYEEIKNG